MLTRAGYALSAPTDEAASRKRLGHVVCTPAAAAVTAACLTRRRLPPGESALALLLVSCLLRSSGASPARHKSHWKNPCALPLAALSGESVLNLPPASDRQILDRIIHLNGMVAPKLDDHLRQFVSMM